MSFSNKPPNAPIKNVNKRSFELGDVARDLDVLFATIEPPNKLICPNAPRKAGTPNQIGELDDIVRTLFPEVVDTPMTPERVQTRRVCPNAPRKTASDDESVDDDVIYSHLNSTINMMSWLPRNIVFRYSDDDSDGETDSETDDEE